MPRRLALLVATYSYEDEELQQLTAPGHDAEGLAEALRDPEIAGFDVTVKLNEPCHVVGQAIGEFFHKRRRDDLTLLYFTGHGLKDDQGRLYLAMTDTRHDQLLFTGLSTNQINEAMEASSSRQQLLILDCCYSGAYPADRIPKADTKAHSLTRFEGAGRVILTASDSIQYAFQGGQVTGEGSGSVFTRYLVEGLTTGEADLDGDGNIALDELYAYAYDHVVAAEPRQHPQMLEHVEGRIVLAHNVHWSLPDHIRHAVQSPFKEQRLAALEELKHLHVVGNDRVRTEVVNQTRALAADDSKTVSLAASELLTTLEGDGVKSQTEKVAAEEQARRQAEAERARRAEERRAQQEAEVARARESEATRQREAEAEQARAREAEEAAVRQRAAEAAEAARQRAAQEAAARQAAAAEEARRRQAESQGTSSPGGGGTTPSEDEKPSFWRTAPGILTVVGVLVAAGAGLAVLLTQTGSDSPPAPFASAGMYEMAQHLFNADDCDPVESSSGGAPLAWDLDPRPDHIVRCELSDGSFTGVFMCNDNGDVDAIRNAYLSKAISGTEQDVSEPPAGWDSTIDGVQTSFKHEDGGSRVYWDSPERGCAAELQNESNDVGATVQYWTTGLT
jgi:caspase domain-containing protein